MKLHYQITVGLRFRAADAPKLRNLASRDWTHPEHERSAFEQAANAAENGNPLVIQCMSREELDEIVSIFPRAGIARPVVHEMRVGQ